LGPLGRRFPGPHIKALEKELEDKEEKLQNTIKELKKYKDRDKYMLFAGTNA
jgi:hypothetical protein